MPWSYQPKTTASLCEKVVTRTVYGEGKIMNHSMRKIAIGTILSFSLSAPLLGLDANVAPATAAQADIVKGDYNGNAQIILDEINKYRVAHGLKKVQYSPTITRIAQDESDRAVRDENFNHSMRFLSDSRAGRWTAAGEVTALDYSINPKGLVNWWKNSPSHKSFLLNPNIEVVGIGVTFVDGSLSRTKQPWRILATVDGFGYKNGGKPSDSRSSVTGGSNVVKYPLASSYELKGAIGSYYRNNGGANTFGNPITGERSIHGGVVQSFSKNGKTTNIYWSSSTGAHAVVMNSGIGTKFSGKGAERGYGLPTTSERKIANGSYQVFRNPTTGKHTKIMWSSKTGTKAIEEWTAIGSAFARNGYEHRVGFPLTDERRTSWGAYQQFQHYNTGKVTTYNWTPRGGLSIR